MGQQKSNHLAHYAEITTIHGIKDLVLSRSRPLRFAWSLCLMAAMGLLCWYTYDTVKYYLSGPTLMTPSTVPLETYPPIHVCFQSWLNSKSWSDASEASSYGFTYDEVSFIVNSFLELDRQSITDPVWKEPISNYRVIKDSVKAKMEQHNLSSVQHMISIVSWNASIESQGSNAMTQRRWLWASDDEPCFVCQSTSNVNLSGDLEIRVPSDVIKSDVYISVGEDLFVEKVFLNPYEYIYRVEIQEIKKRILLNRPGFECTHHYNSVQACLLDCKYKREVCNCNGTASIVSYNNSESFWLLNADCHESPFKSNCNESYDYCRTQCTPCITWNYNYTLTNQHDDTNEDYDNTILRLTKVPQNMEITEQVYSYTASSMLSYLGGLLGLCCGASVLSLVQVFLFWWGDGCHIGKNKVKDTVVEHIAEEDNIQGWVEQATLHIQHCKPCSMATAANMQLQKSEYIQISQQKTNHLANYAHNTTIHGIKDFMLMKNKLLKLVWGLFVLALASLMCEEIYRKVMKYIGGETAMTISVVGLDTYPTIHVCSDTWYNDTQARSYGFTEEDLAFIRLAFQDPETARYEDILIKLNSFGYDDMWEMVYEYDTVEDIWNKTSIDGGEGMWMNMTSIDGNNTAFEEQKKSVQLKMEQHNLKTIRDMLNLITWNLSIQGHEFAKTSKRWRGRVLEIGNNTYVCHSVSNASAQHDLSIALPGKRAYDHWAKRAETEFIVVGEDPFGESMKYGYFDEDNKWIPRLMTLKILGVSELSLVGKDGTCNKGHNSSGVCLQDCASQKDLCSCNGTIKIASYENSEDFFLLASRHDCRVDPSCNQSYDSCVEMCKPCTTWDYQVTTQIYDRNDDADVPLNIMMFPRMIVSQEYYTYPVRPLLSNIGGLLGAFCGASVLSLVQFLLFWWDDGCLLSKTKGTKKNNTEDHIKAWLLKAALRIPQCKLCKKLTSTRTQNNQGGETKANQSECNHLANYAENTTIHGIKDLVFCKNKLIKLAWGLILLMVFCLMCEEIYGTVRDYADSPTGIDESIILLNKYPPAHVCTGFEDAYLDTQAKAYGFDDDETDIIRSVFSENKFKVNTSQSASIKRKLEQYNLSTVQDMLNIVTVNTSINPDSVLPDDPVPQKRWRREFDGAGYTNYVCYTFSNLKVRDGGLAISNNFSELKILSKTSDLFFAIGEDPFAQRHDIPHNALRYGSLVDVWISESNQLSLINKGGTCRDDYNSSGVCLQDCVAKESACNSSYPAGWPSYENNELFWLFVNRTDNDNTTCQHSLEECTANCNLIPPCRTWEYQISTNFFEYSDHSSKPFLRLILNPSMIVSQQYYSYPASSLLANIGGLVSLFCGGSVLSIAQVILFWWGDGNCRQKGKEREEDITVVPEDDIHKWIQHAALHRA